MPVGLSWRCFDQLCAEQKLCVSRRVPRAVVAGHAVDEQQSNRSAARRVVQLALVVVVVVDVALALRQLDSEPRQQHGRCCADRCNRFTDLAVCVFVRFVA